MINLMQRISDLAAFTRQGLEAILYLLAASGRPAMALVPVDRRRAVIGGQRYSSISGESANAAVCMHVAPGSEAWCGPFFGKTKTGDNRHSQSSRFAT